MLIQRGKMTSECVCLCAVTVPNAAACCPRSVTELSYISDFAMNVPYIHCDRVFMKKWAICNMQAR